MNLSLLKKIEDEINMIATLRAKRVQKQNKRRRTNPDELDLTPVLRGLMQIRHGAPKSKQIRILVDTGASTTVIDSKLCTKLRQRKVWTQQYSVPGKGLVQANTSCKIHL